MPLSRRGFLEASALSATGLALENLVPAMDAFGQTEELQNKLRTTDGHPPLEARLVLSLDQDWQFFRPLVASVKGSDSRTDTAPPRDAGWEPATLPHTVRLEPRDVSGGANYQGIC